jgi:hypothetical protein
LRAFENRMLRRIFGHKREEVAEGWRRLHDEELCNLYASPNMIRVFKSRRMRRVGQVACKGAMKNSYKILVRKNGRNHSEDICIGGRVVL